MNLYSKVTELLPEVTDVYINYDHPKLRYKGSKKSMELDIFIPSLHLAFEYQGIQHFELSNYVFVPSLMSKKVKLLSFNLFLERSKQERSLSSDRNHSH